MAIEGDLHLVVSEEPNRLVIEIQSEPTLPEGVALAGMFLAMMRYCEKHELSIEKAIELAKEMARTHLLLADAKKGGLN